MSFFIKTLVLSLAATQVPVVLGLQRPPKSSRTGFSPLDQGFDPYPACNTIDNPDCIEGGKYLVPDLNFSNPGDAGDTAYHQYMPTHTFTVSRWTNGLMPENCYYWAITVDQWNAADFVMYNVTFSDCPSTPFVVCYNNKAPKSITEIATEISRIPIGMRQSTSLYLVYGDLNSDNPNYGGYMATYSPHGIIIGRSTGYFTTSLVHETGHAIDCTLASQDATHPQPGTCFSSTSTWKNAADTDNYAVSAYGTTNYVEDFADTGRAVLIDNIYPGGLAAFTSNNPNLTQITHQLNAFKAVAGSYYTTGGTCDLTKKFPYPTSFSTVAPTTTTITSPANTATAAPYGQCGGWPTTTVGPTLCPNGFKCSSVNQFYSQCTPTPAP